MPQYSANAFSKDFAKVLHWEDVYGEDAYAYFLCKEKGFAFAYAKNAIAMFRVPPVLADHIKQSRRYIASIEGNRKIFGDKIVSEAYAIPTKLLLASFIKHFFMHPILTTSYVMITAYRYAMPRLRTDLKYIPHEEVVSTKELHLK